MDKIKDVYYKDIYKGFLEYCQKQNFTDMCDLIHCPFALLADEPNIAPVLSRIQMTFLAYRKTHPDIFKEAREKSKQIRRESAPVVSKRASVPTTSVTRTKPAVKKPAITDFAAETKMMEYFKENSDKLISIAELSKFLGKSLTRTQILSVLEKTSWCKVVDNSTFFYSPTN